MIFFLEVSSLYTQHMLHNLVVLHNLVDIEVFRFITCAMEMAHVLNWHHYWISTWPQASGIGEKEKKEHPLAFESFYQSRICSPRKPGCKA